MTTTTITAEFISPHEFVHHPDNRPGGLVDAHINSLANAMRAKGFDDDYFVKYVIPDDTWPKEHSALIGKKVLVGGHNRTEAAKRANLKTIPARLKEMTYLETLEFLDRDNEQSPLHWYERLIINEKRREIMGLSAFEYGTKVLGHKGHSPSNCEYVVKQVPSFVKLKDAGITTSDLQDIALTTAFAITRSVSPPSDYKALFAEVRLGTLPRNHEKLSPALRERYAPVVVSSTIPNATSYLYIASSPNTPLIKCGMTTGNDPAKYVAQKARDTWSLDFSCDFFVEIPTVHIQAADAAMRDKLSKGWGAFREFYTARPMQAKKVLLEIAAQFADPDDITTD
jgi:hypothetical protein